VSAEEALTFFDVKGQHDKNDEGHGRLGGKEGVGPDGKADGLVARHDLEYNGGGLIQHGENGQKPQDQNLFPLKPFYRSVVQKEHEQGTEKQVDKEIEAHVALRKGLAQDEIDVLCGFGGVLDEDGHGAQKIALVDREEGKDHAGGHGPVAQDLPAVAFLALQDGCEVGDQEKGQRKRRDGLQNGDRRLIGGCIGRVKLLIKAH